ALAAPALAETANPSAPVTRGEFDKLVRETLINNPEILTDAIKVLHDRQQESADKESTESLSKRQDDLFKDTVSPSIGPKNADVTIVEFFDYHCGYCKHMLPTITKLIEKDKKVRVIFREFPILSEDSVLAARAAIAVNTVAPAKYFDFHAELMKASGKYDEQMLTDAAVKLGVDAKKFQAAFESKETTAQLDKNRALAEDLGIRGTPAIVFPDKILPGAVKYDQLQKLVDDHRNGVKDKAE
ncbi:MAG: DsbA family protein, partial [Rickettsiales bacterium]|nr:DsbA family protein [Rickettsiales bacterium]